MQMSSGRVPALAVTRAIIEANVQKILSWSVIAALAWSGYVIEVEERNLARRAWSSIELAIPDRIMRWERGLSDVRFATEAGVLSAVVVEQSKLFAITSAHSKLFTREERFRAYAGEVDAR